MLFNSFEFIVFFTSFFLIYWAFLNNNHYQKNRSKIIQFISKTAKENNIHFYNFDKVEISKNKKYFLDYSHLNPRGSIIFSTLLADSPKVK